MADRRTFASVTDTPCTCNYLQSAADDAQVPIVFDSQTGEFHFTYGTAESQTRGTLIIYHCPFCGGAAPKSKRRLLFSVIPAEEERRLAKLLAPVRTVRSAMKRLGRPDRDDPAGMRVNGPEREGQPPAVEHFRTLVYERLSELADVWITERADRRVHWRLQGKPKGSEAP